MTNFTIARAAFSTILVAICIVPLQQSAGQPITLQERVSMTGKVKSVSPGVIVVTDEEGKSHELKIQEDDESAVSLGGAQVIVRMPATVSVTGESPAESLARGTRVQFEGEVNRLGSTQGELKEVTVLEQDDEARLGIQIKEEPAERGGFIKCQVTGEVQRILNDRLLVSVPRSEVTSRTTLSFALAEDAVARFQSSNYRRAVPGSTVDRAIVAKFSTGDLVVQEIDLTLPSEATVHATEDDKLLARYREISDEPKPPRDVRSQHFLLHTDISDRKAQILLDKLETMIGLVSKYFGRPPGGLIECYVVRDLSQWPRDSMPEQAAAKIARDEGVTVSASLGRQRKSIVYSCDTHKVVQHEAIHAYCHQTFGSTGPTWYSEGVAELGAYWKKDQLAVDIDPVVIDYLKNAEPKKMLDIVAAGQITGDSWQAYAWRWALCHLLSHNPNYMGRFTALGIAMMLQQPGASFESVYGPVAKEISFEYDQFVKVLDNGYRADLCAWQWNQKFLPLVGDRRARTQVLARYGWQASNVRVEEGVSYDVAAVGQWQINTVDGPLTADGDESGRGRLVGVVMHDFQLSDPMELGARATFVAPVSGDVYLRCRDAWNQIADNDGAITVHFRRTPKSE